MIYTVLASSIILASVVAFLTGLGTIQSGSDTLASVFFASGFAFAFLFAANWLLLH